MRRHSCTLQELRRAEKQTKSATVRNKMGFDTLQTVILHFVKKVSFQTGFVKPEETNNSKMVVLLIDFND